MLKSSGGNQPHLPLVVLGMALELDQPILLAIAHGAVVHGDDERAGQQGAWGAAAHHRAQHRLAVVHRGPAGAARGADESR